jgi:renal tumor antigen
MDFNFPEKKGTGLERLIPHADMELIELMKKLIRYDPDERILARQALKDPYFRDLRDAEKDANQQASALQPAGADRSRGGRDHASMMQKVGMSTSSSVASADHENPETTHEPAGGGPAADEERTPALPTIRQENRKERERAAREAAAAKAAQGSGAESGEEAGGEEGTVLPPIAVGGLKVKRGGGKMASSLKQAGNATLQKPSMPSASSHGGAAAYGSGAGPNRALGVLGTSKGFAGTYSGGAAPAASSTDAMSSTNPHGWAAKDPEHRRAASPNSAATIDKMNSTWAPNHNEKSRRYVSPFGAKIAPDKKGSVRR